LPKLFLYLRLGTSLNTAKPYHKPFGFSYLDHNAQIHEKNLTSILLSMSRCSIINLDFANPNLCASLSFFATTHEATINARVNTNKALFAFFISFNCFKCLLLFSPSYNCRIKPIIIATLLIAY
jgi:hypothetical protein